ncbi:hypothetical protein EMIHUDRAFT_217991 [Emiliania huxleyi CCMP1516]|uniref:Myb-like domain-containing protein n=2 Tax=Emiliania huxleyi TaxID=2903 RepID=A0A0D3I9M9_EMIH1|nr:hypothetical protein EMIHUDRAFT_217991 [Emiliania huxleyi CCMP1516]EOD07964.1 hypothetical protein EMIHUDRAFT_217991 [Emiliania huxleyi CCMP1516]|eukprot:XP_005760393.1 hypothetical protein EMIHUDRAFT_217991 [Emiliania huxleyi CCMP1516]
MTGGVHEHMRAWEPEEDRTILRLLGELGPKWSRIVLSLPGACAPLASRKHRRSVSSVRNRWQRIEKGRKLREAGHASKNRCQRCGAPKRGHVCLAKLDQRASADAVAAAGLGQGGGGVATSAPSLPRHTQASGREAAASGASAAVGGVSAAAGGVSAALAAAALMAAQAEEAEAEERVNSGGATSAAAALPSVPMPVREMSGAPAVESASSAGAAGERLGGAARGES